MTSKLESKYRHLVKKAGHVRGLLFTNYIVFRKKRKIIRSTSYKTMADSSEEAYACAVEGRTNKRRGREKKLWQRTLWFTCYLICRMGLHLSTKL